MFRLESLRVIFLAAILLPFNSPLWAAEGIITKDADPTGSYCHLRFPAIREDTLFGDRPVLKDPAEGDLIDFYGPCNHDPLGREEVFRQRADLVRERRNRLNSD
jgi:hypothetical protein